MLCVGVKIDNIYYDLTLVRAKLHIFWVEQYYGGDVTHNVVFAIQTSIKRLI